MDSMGTFENGGAMRSAVAALAGVALVLTFTPPGVAQQTPPHATYPKDVPSNAPGYVKSVDVPGLNVRYLDFKYDEEAFATLEKGGSHPVGRRTWVLARLMTKLAPFSCEGKTVPVGPSVLILHPAKAGAGPTLEVRRIDLREVFVDLNVVAEAPPGETFCQRPADFRKVDAMAGRLEVTLTEGKGTIDVISHYGDREARITLIRK
jgi:hypothetical protein